MIKECEICDKQIIVKPCRFKRTKFCSKKCQNYSKKILWSGDNNPTKKRNISKENHPLWIINRPKCIDCLCDLKPKGNTTSARCKKCNYIYLSGPNNSAWKGGISSLSNKLRKSVKYFLWRESVYIRDNYTCVLCNARGAYLNAHHIRKFADNPSLRLELINGITLCEKCHKKHVNRYEKEYEDYFDILILGRENYVR